VLKSSVDDKSFTGDQTCSVAEEEDGGIGDVPNDTLTSEGNERLNGTPAAGNGEAAHALGGGNGSRSDDVRSNTPWALLDGNHTREGVNTSLGGGDVGLVRKAYQTVVNTPVPARSMLALPL